MTFDRLPAHLEVAGILRRVEASGGFGAVLRKGDAERGSLLLVIGSRGRHIAILERMLSPAGSYEWRRAALPESLGSAKIGNFLAKRARFDEDLWAIELDVADAERFIAETTDSG